MPERATDATTGPFTTSPSRWVGAEGDRHRDQRRDAAFCSVQKCTEWKFDASKPSPAWRCNAGKQQVGGAEQRQHDSSLSRLVTRLLTTILLSRKRVTQGFQGGSHGSEAMETPT